MIRGYKDGEKSKAICDTCSKVVNTTIRTGDFILHEEKFPGIQQGFCDECGDSVALTHKGAVQLSKLRKK